MKVAVIGTGYVGLVVGACLAEAGNSVVCVDVDQARIGQLQQGDVPFYEPGLEPLLRRNAAGGRLGFTGDIGRAVEASDVIFITVGTPADDAGSADLRQVLSVARSIGEHMNGPKIVITKSTAPVGTAVRVRAAIAERTVTPFHVCSNPEFLKEGAAVEDFMKPDRVVIGVDSVEVRRPLEELFAPFVRTGAPLIFMDIASAEMTKYAANAMLATRISFMNHIAEVCEAAGADVSLVRRGIGSDRRIGPAFLFAGPGFGGSCLPKDLEGLCRTSEQCGVPADLPRAVQATNTRQRRRVFEKLRGLLGGDVAGRTVVVWGLAFKAETDDIRESPAIALVESLLREGAVVRAYDPQAMAAGHRVLGDRIEFGTDPYTPLGGADALAVMTEWMVFRNPDFERIRAVMRQPVMLDGRNLYDPVRMRAMGFRYVGIGRGGAA